MELDYLLHKNLCDGFSGIGMFDRDKVPIFAEPVHDHQDNIIAVRFRETYNEIKANIFPYSLWDG